jgi:hypothetical protein
MEIILGVGGGDKFELEYVVLQAKWYIHKTKLNKQNVSFIEFLKVLKYYIHVENVMYSRKSQHELFIERFSKLEAIL